MNNNQYPLVSIIIPTYNRADLLPRAINSCLNQTYKNLEIIIIDDGSTDNTEQVVKIFKDERIVYIKNERNKGIPATRNVGLKIAKGKFIGFLDHDDEFLPEKIEKQVNSLINNPDRDISVCERYEYNIYTDTTSLKKIPDIFLQQILIKQSCFDKIGLFDERFYTIDDTEIQVRFKMFQLKTISINKPLIIRYLYKDSASVTISLIKSINDNILIYTKHKNTLRKKFASTICYRIGKNYLKLKEFKKAGIWFLKSFLKYPLNLQSLLKIVGYVIPGLLCKSFYRNRKR
ncbi:MAG: glycosyltransferase [Candidatus Omnitrophica bacterium]|jgi:glycosyltransferase involved in cell wall biosynthesis|nr:glycosyltransferase [Candidatus Omnitrophota bacterium]